MHYAFYIASAIGGIGLFMAMPRRGYTPLRLGGLLGGCALGALWLYLAGGLPEAIGLTWGAFAYYYVFSALAIGAAVRVITHTQPVYAALWFVMVVLASSGLFLVLSAEFMAFAMVIIYGGAILVTYLFVMMLASQDQEPAGWGGSYDRVSYEPAAAVAVGFLLLATLLTVFFKPMTPNPAARGLTDEQILATVLTDRPAQRLARHVGADESTPLPAALADPDHLSNSERIGLDLFHSHPLGLELAGVILLVSLVGAVVIARKRIEPDGAEPAGV